MITQRISRRRPILFIVSLVSLAIWTLVPAAHAGNQLVYSTGPGSVFTSYTVPVLVIHVGDTVKFINGDVFSHNVEELCEPNLTPSSCPPRFTSPLRGLLGGPDPLHGNIGDVVTGVEKLPAGTFKFTCIIHASMIGTLVVVS